MNKKPVIVQEQDVETPEAALEKLTLENAVLRVHLIETQIQFLSAQNQILQTQHSEASANLARLQKQAQVTQ